MPECRAVFLTFCTAKAKIHREQSVVFMALARLFSGTQHRRLLRHSRQRLHRLVWRSRPAAPGLSLSFCAAGSPVLEAGDGLTAAPVAGLVVEASTGYPCRVPGAWCTTGPAQVLCSWSASWTPAGQRPNLPTAGPAAGTWWTCPDSGVPGARAQLTGARRDLRRGRAPRQNPEHDNEWS